MSSTFNYETATVLVTGASSGIGEGFAHEFAKRGSKLILASRRQELLADVAATLRAQYDIAVHVVAVDLAKPDGVEQLVEAVRAQGLDVDVLVNNAGFGTHGLFAELPAEREHEEIMLNVAAPVKLTRLLLPAMVARQRGLIINVASAGAFEPTPYMATYSATKSFMLTFTESLAIEQHGTGVNVLAVCPGPTDTEFAERAGMEDDQERRTVAQVMATTFTAIEHGDAVAIDSSQNAAMGWTSSLLPRRIVVLADDSKKPKPPFTP